MDEGGLENNSSNGFESRIETIAVTSNSAAQGGGDFLIDSLDFEPPEIDNISGIDESEYLTCLKKTLDADQKSLMRQDFYRI